MKIGTILNVYAILGTWNENSIYNKTTNDLEILEQYLNRISMQKYDIVCHLTELYCNLLTVRCSLKSALTQNEYNKIHGEIDFAMKHISNISELKLAEMPDYNKVANYAIIRLQQNPVFKSREVESFIREKITDIRKYDYTLEMRQKSDADFVFAIVQTQCKYINELIEEKAELNKIIEEIERTLLLCEF